MKRIIFTLALLFTLTINAQIIDTVKVMQIHTADGVESFELDNIDYIDFYYKINITPEKEPIDTAGLYELVQIETKADKLDYKKEFTEQEVGEAIDALQVQFTQAKGGRYAMRGGKEASMPSSPAYQRQYLFGPDLYAGYFTIPHNDFMYGKHTSSYDLSADFNGDALGSYTMAKNAFIPLLHTEEINNLPEIKAINLLFYCISAQEQADLAGPFKYFEDKQNLENPRVYDNIRSIYYSIVKDLDNIVACLQYYDNNRPQWYKDMIENVLAQHHDTNPKFYLEGDMGFSTYIKLANSLKLRMAMHIVKVESDTAKKWAESAVDPANGGVIESEWEQHGLYPMFLGFGHPLIDINNWGDFVLSASLETLIMSLNHPYSQAGYVFDNNNNEIFNEEKEETLPTNTRICGLRSGTMVGAGPIYYVNQLQAFSKINTESWSMAMPPLYFIKWAEVDFLRAEGALRGWNMGGDAQFFYERGIRNGYLDCPMFVDMLPYKTLVEEYMQQETATEYWNVDPTGESEAWESPTRIGVKWNEADSREVKLEKIITQKYLALFPLSTEAWTELRRTGYPQIFPVLNPDDGDGSLEYGDIIRRIPWVPTDEVAKEQIEESGIKRLGGPDEQATRLWWDVDKANF